MEQVRDYWNNKNSRALTAKTHSESMSIKYSDKIENCFKNSKIYRFQNMTKTTEPCKEKPLIIMENTGTVESIQRHYSDGKVAALNFASYKNPGGGFLAGSCAQEECLCHSSFLYNVLEKFKSTFYDLHTYTNNGMYTSEGIYSPDILFLNDYKCNIITVAAPNKSVFIKYGKGSETINQNSLLERIKFIFEIAKAENIDTLILGAFGCGVFMQDPEEVANDFKYFIENYNYNLKKVVFAVPDDRFKKNYQTFVNIFGGKK